MEAHTFVIIDRWVKCRLFTIPLNTIDDGITVGLPQALAQEKDGVGEIRSAIRLMVLRGLFSLFPLKNTVEPNRLILVVF